MITGLECLRDGVHMGIPVQSEWNEDRSEWDRAWSCVPHYVVQTWNRDTLDSILKPLLGSNSAAFLVSLSISEDPIPYADKGYRPSTVCPLCGNNVNEESIVAATLHPVIDMGVPLGSRSFASFGVWAHRGCLDRCARSETPSPIPW